MDPNVDQDAEKQKKETFESQLTWSEYIISFVSRGSPALFVMVAILWVCSMFYAAYLSWSCNSNLNTNIVLKLIAALHAFSWGPFYISYYMLSWQQSLCYFASRMNVVAPLAAAATTVVAQVPIQAPAVQTAPQ